MDDWNRAWNAGNATDATLQGWQHPDSDPECREWSDLPDWPGDEEAGAGTHIVITDTVVEADRSG